MEPKREAMQEFKFDRYRLFYRSGSSDYSAKITCYGSSTRVAMIFFINGNGKLPDNDLRTLPMKVYYKLACFQDVMFILENEKPLSLYVFENGSTCEIGSREFIT